MAEHKGAEHKGSEHDDIAHEPLLGPKGGRKRTAVELGVGLAALLLAYLAWRHSRSTAAAVGAGSTYSYPSGMTGAGGGGTSSDGGQAMANLSDTVAQLQQQLATAGPGSTSSPATGPHFTPPPGASMSYAPAVNADAQILAGGSLAAIQSRIAAIYTHRGVAVPTNLAGQAQQAMASGSFDAYRQQANDIAGGLLSPRTQTGFVTAGPGAIGAPTVGPATSSTGTAQPHAIAAPAINADSQYTGTAAAAAQRISDIYTHRGLAVPTNLSALAAQAQSSGSFEAIRATANTAAAGY